MELLSAIQTVQALRTDLSSARRVSAPLLQEQIASFQKTDGLTDTQRVARTRLQAVQTAGRNVMDAFQTLAEKLNTLREKAEVLATFSSIISAMLSNNRQAGFISGLAEGRSPNAPGILPAIV
ncbi:MAG: hypothetical protein HY735_37660 [Verrucomicrobia bacterium]|nr:hypothetical protein [Verrucomicrobiota bacterium]